MYTVKFRNKQWGLYFQTPGLFEGHNLWRGYLRFKKPARLTLGGKHGSQNPFG